MGFIETVDHDRRRLRVRAEGRIDLAEVRRHLERERDDGGLGYPELIDARAATVALSPDDVRAVVPLLRGLRRRASLGPTAVVVAADVDYGVMRMLETLLESVADLRPFRT